MGGSWWPRGPGLGPGTGKARVPAHRSTSGPGRGSDGWDRSLSRRLSSPTTATATSGKHSQHLLGGREGRKVCHRRTDSAGHRPGSSRAGRGGRARETGRGAPGGGGGRSGRQRGLGWERGLRCHLFLSRPRPGPVLISTSSPARPGCVSSGASRELETTSAPWLLPGRNCPEPGDAGLQQLPPLPADSACRAPRLQSSAGGRPGIVPGSPALLTPTRLHFGLHTAAQPATAAASPRVPTERWRSQCWASAALPWASLCTSSGGTSGSCLIHCVVPHLQARHLCIRQRCRKTLELRSVTSGPKAGGECQDTPWEVASVRPSVKWAAVPG